MMSHKCKRFCSLLVAKFPLDIEFTPLCLSLSVNIELVDLNLYQAQGRFRFFFSSQFGLVSFFFTLAGSAYAVP